MRKIFTLLASCVMATGFYTNAAEQVLIEYNRETTAPLGITVIADAELGTVKNNAGTSINCINLRNGRKIDDATKSITGCVKLEVNGGLKKGDVVTIAGAINNDKGRRATAKLATFDGAATTDLYTFADFVNWYDTATDAVDQTFTLAEDCAALYIIRDGGTQAKLLHIKVSRQTESEGPENPTVAPTFEFSAANATVAYNETAVLPTLNYSEDIPAEAITYSLSNKFVASVENGVVTPLLPGWVKVTASFAGNEKYDPATASYILNVTRPYQAVESKGTVYAFDRNVMITGQDGSGKDIYAAREVTYPDGLKLTIDHKDAKQFQSMPNIMVNGAAYSCIKLSNGAPLIITAPEGKLISNVTVYSMVNYNNAVKGYAAEASYWIDLDGVAQELTAESVMTNYVDNEDNTNTPDVVTFAVDNKASVSIKNKGNQPGVVLVVEYAAEVAEAPEAPAASHEAIEYKNEDVVVTFTPAADHHEVYTHFAPAVVENPDAPVRAMDHGDFVKAEGNQVTVSGPGVLSYYAYDPTTDQKSETKTINVTDGTVGISNIAADANAPVEYFNLQGIRVANPENGVFIRRQGSKVSKVVK